MRVGYRALGNNNNLLLLVITAVISVIAAFLGQDVHAANLHVSNLNSSCMRCLCYAATSCHSPGCVEGYCGPFYISRIYWADADRHVLKNDDAARDKAWEDCARDYGCGSALVTNYMRRYGRDCNGNGVTDCDDFSSLHYNGGFDCDKSIAHTSFGRRYEQCKRGLVDGILGLQEG